MCVLFSVSPHPHLLTSTSLPLKHHTTQTNHSVPSSSPQTFLPSLCSYRNVPSFPSLNLPNFLTSSLLTHTHKVIFIQVWHVTEFFPLVLLYIKYHNTHCSTVLFILVHPNSMTIRVFSMSVCMCVLTIYSPYTPIPFQHLFIHFLSVCCKSSLLPLNTHYLSVYSNVQNGIYLCSFSPLHAQHPIQFTAR